MRPKLLDIILRIIEQSQRGSVEWEDASTLSTGEKFRAVVGETIMETSEHSRFFEDEYAREVEEKFIRIQILNAAGRILEDKTVSEASADFELATQLFETARSKSRKSEEILDRLLQKLGA